MPAARASRGAQDCVRQDLGRPHWSTTCDQQMTAPACSTSTGTWCTKSPARRPSKACAWRTARCARRKRRWPSSTTTCRPRRPGARHQERGKPHPGRGTGLERSRFRRRVFQRERQAPGHRPHRRPGAGLHPARHDHRLRRQPHLDAWRFRRAGARHRHLGGRACARHPDADPEKSQEHAGRGQWRSCPKGVTAKDIILAIIGEIGTAGGTGYVIEFAGEAIRALSMEGRMTVCNMTIEGGARAGLIAPDEKTYDLHSRAARARPRARPGTWPSKYWKTLPSTRARITTRSSARRRRAAADRHLGHLAGGRDSVTGAVPNPDEIADENKRASKWRALDYMGLKPGTPITDIKIDRSSSARAPMAASRICARRQGGRRQDRQ
jgi:hypothetical protein